MRFRDRVEAGRQLAERLRAMDGDDIVVLGLPRGGVPVAAVIAKVLRAPLDVVVVRKLGVPTQPELAMGAIGEGGLVVWNDDVLRLARLTEADTTAVVARERAEVARRAAWLRGDAGRRMPVAGRVAVIVDDGVATGSTAIAACRITRAEGASRVVVAVPVAPPATIRKLRAEADEVVCLHTPQGFLSVGEWYDDFSQVTEEEVVRLLRSQAAADDGPVYDRLPQAHPRGHSSAVGLSVSVDAGGVTVPGELTVPDAARGLVLFAHGSGSSRLSPRNRAVAAALNDAGLATLLFDLLTAEEKRDRDNVFDVELLARRLDAAVEWARRQPAVADLPIGLFGASTGAAAALWAAAEPGSPVAAVVCRGGRPDLARPRLPWVNAPTLLIVGGRDGYVLDLNRRAQALLHCRTDLQVVAGAGHLFDQPGALETVATLAGEWFVEHLARSFADHS